MVVVLLAIAVVFILCAIAGGATNQALRGHLAEIGGDFGSPAVAGHDAELRRLIAAGESHR